MKILMGCRLNLKMINSKKAITLTPNEIIELILVIAGMFLLLIAFLAFTNPGFDVNKETAKSYLATFEKEVQKADAGKIGEFMIWQNFKDTSFLLVYFGNKRSAEITLTNNKKETWTISAFTRSKNTFCVCYYDSSSGKHSCTECYSLDGGVKNFGSYILIGQKIYIKKASDNYLMNGNNDFSRLTMLTELQQLVTEAEQQQKIQQQEEQAKLARGEGVIFVAYTTDSSVISPSELYFRYSLLSKYWEFAVRNPGDPVIEKFQDENWFIANTKSMDIFFNTNSVDPSAVLVTENQKAAMAILTPYKNLLVSLATKDYPSGKTLLDSNKIQIYLPGPSTPYANV